MPHPSINNTYVCVDLTACVPSAGGEYKLPFLPGVLTFLTLFDLVA